MDTDQCMWVWRVRARARACLIVCKSDYLSASLAVCAMYVGVVCSCARMFVSVRRSGERESEGGRGSKKTPSHPTRKKIK